MVSEGIHTQYPPTPRFRDTKTDRGGVFPSELRGRPTPRVSHPGVLYMYGLHIQAARCPNPSDDPLQQQARHPGDGDMPVQADWRSRPRRRRRMRARQDAPEQKHHSKEQGHRSETLQAGSVVCMPRAGIQASHFIWRGPDFCGYRGRVKQKAAVNGPFPLCGVDMACDGGGGGVWWKCLGPCPGPVPLLPSDGTAARCPRASSRCGTHSIHTRRGRGGKADDQKSLELPTWFLAGWLSHRPALTNGTTMAEGGQNPSFGYDEGEEKGGRGWARRSRSGPRAEIERDVELQPAIVSSAEYSTCPPLFGCQG